MNRKNRIAVLISGGGTNLQSLIDAITQGEIPNAEIVIVISSNLEAKGLERAKMAGIPGRVPKGPCDSREYSENLMHLLLEAKPDLVVLAGYLKILDKEIVNAFLGRIVNIHPSLLPKYGGKGCYGLKVHEMVLESGDTVTGATIHYVTEGVDQGEIILQHQMGVEKTDTPESLASRVLDLEHQLMVEGVKKVLMEMDGRSGKWEDC